MRPSRIPRLSHLRDLTVHCHRVQTSRDAAYLYKWVRRVVTYAPLESLRLLCEPHSSGAAPSFDPLLEHLIARHAQRPRLLMADDRELPHSYVFGFGPGWVHISLTIDSTLTVHLCKGFAPGQHSQMPRYGSLWLK